MNEGVVNFRYILHVSRCQIVFVDTHSAIFYVCVYDLVYICFPRPSIWFCLYLQHFIVCLKDMNYKQLCCVIYFRNFNIKEKKLCLFYVYQAICILSYQRFAHEVENGKQTKDPSPQAPKQTPWRHTKINLIWILNCLYHYQKSTQLNASSIA